MRTDHNAFQRATRVAGFGLLLQTFVVGLLLLVVGNWLKDTALTFASYYVLYGGLVWLSLIVLFQQHKLERLEALEHDEFAREGFEAGSAFDVGDETRVAARRLERLYKWVMPASSLLVAGLLGGTAWLMIRWFAREQGSDLDGAVEFQMTENRGWALAICLSAAAVSFIFSRFVAGMSKQPVWQNLRAGAGYMVGNSLVLLAVAVGIICRFFDRDGVLYAVTYAIPIFMIFVAAETLLNFVLNLYRPRIPGEMPRPAFDSKVLSLLAAPDNLVRSINEAVNYQFGFDVTSSWGYQLLLRSFGRLVVFGLIILVVLNTIVIVEPFQQAVRLSSGRILDEAPRGSGPMFKLPWPFQSAMVFDVSRIREIRLTARRLARSQVDLWEGELRGDVDFEPFLVVSPKLELRAGDRDADAAIDDESALVDAEIYLQYRIKEDGGLVDYLQFAPDAVSRRHRMTIRERLLKVLATREITRELSRMELDAVLTTDRAGLMNRLRDRVQSAFDEQAAGVEVVAVNFQMLRPAGESIEAFEEFPLSIQARMQTIAEQRGRVAAGLAGIVGDPESADRVLQAIGEYERIERESGSESPEAIAQRVAVEEMLLVAGGEAAQALNLAERDRWNTHMDALAKANEVLGQFNAYRAAPGLYRERHIMNVLSQTLAFASKYVIGVDPERIRVETDLRPVESLLGLDLESDGASQ